jgi:hypothetical protein
LYCDKKVEYIRTYPVDSLQIYFSGSLELQKELISHGFYVPQDPDKKVKMPIPIIYANFKGWVEPREAITIERLIPPEWLGLSARDLGWVKTVREGKDAYIIPEEEIYVNVGLLENVIVFDLDIKSYHLERTSIRLKDPVTWNNWAMFYIGFDHIEDILNTFCKDVNPSYCKPEPIREDQQGGKEKTCYCRVSIADFSLCLGCFNLALTYIKNKAVEHCRNYPHVPFCRDGEKGIDEVIKSLKLRLRYKHNVYTYAKVGVARIEGKRPQIMIKIASEGPSIMIESVAVRGKKVVEGKARGELIHCNHELQRHCIALDRREFCCALMIARSYISNVDRCPKSRKKR